MTRARSGAPAAIDRRELAAIYAGGAAGALIRAVLSRQAATAPGSWPWATFVVNIAGALLLGYLVAYLRARPRRYARALIGTGFCGALTTFSTMMLELLRMLDARHAGLAGAYLLASVACGLGAVATGRRLGARA